MLACWWVWVWGSPVRHSDDMGGVLGCLQDTVTSRGTHDYCTNDDVERKLSCRELATQLG